MFASNTHTYSPVSAGFLLIAIFRWQCASYDRVSLLSLPCKFNAAAIMKCRRLIKLTMRYIVNEQQNRHVYSLHCMRGMTCHVFRSIFCFQFLFCSNVMYSHYSGCTHVCGWAMLFRDHQHHHHHHESMCRCCMHNYVIIG